MEISEIRNAYIEGFGQPEDNLLKELTRETALTQIHPRMICGNHQGQLLSLLVKLSKAENILEIGTFSGYSTICMARALPEKGKITTIEINDEIQWLNSKYFHLAKLENKINPIVGDALELIPKLNEQFDFVFIDGDKRQYIDYYQMVFPYVISGGLILVDNVLWDNKIFRDVESNDFMTKGVIEFNEMIKMDAHVEKLIIPLRDGLMLIRKL
ncbi:MAG TPA: class I SAM-dependent methyltransferase [Bacteroidales bacterium]|nr:class I SAM-dependent methyltransferase [Bacteroidales bacterium]